MSTVSCHHAKAALGGIIRQGHDPDQLLIRAGINPRLINAAHARVSDHQMTALVQLIWITLADEFMGFTATPCQQGAFALMAQLVYRCDNLGEALRLGCRFYNLLTDDIHTELLETDKEAQLKISFKNPQLDPESFYQEFWLIIWHRFSSWLTGKKIPLIETTLVYDKPTHSAELHYLFPGRHCFNSAANQLVFNADELKLPLIRDKQQLNRFLINSPADLMTIPGDDNSLRNTISLLIKTHNKAAPQTGLSFPPLSQIASQLNISQITLHRKLKTEGTSYQQIKDTIRRDIALTKLIKERLKVKQVAELVGFSESSSFTRAFKEWTGLTPREYCKFINPGM